MPDMWQRFSNPATRVIHFAQEEAKQMGLNVVGTEHILVGLIREEEGVAARVLERLGVDLRRVRTELDSQVGATDHLETGSHRLTLSQKAKKALEYSLEEARELNPKLGLQNFVDTEHILLGLIREGVNSGSKAVRLLDGLGVDPERVRSEVLNYLGAPSGTALLDVEQLPLDQSNKRRLTQAAKQALQYARIEAAMQGVREAGPEYLLMGLARESLGVAGRALDRLGLKLLELRGFFGASLPTEEIAPENVKFGPTAAPALARAVDELEDFHVRYGTELFLDTEHLLLGVLGVKGSPIPEALKTLGIDPQRVRQEVLSMVGLVAPMAAEEIQVAPSRKGVDVWLSLSEPAFRILTLAGEEAHRHGTEVIDVPHLAAGLLRFNEAALARQGVMLDQVLAVLFGEPAAPGAAAPSLSPQCADLLGLAYQAALKGTPSGALVRITPVNLVQALLEGADAFGYDTVRKLTDLGIDLERYQSEL